MASNGFEYTRGWTDGSGTPPSWTDDLLTDVGNDVNDSCAWQDGGDLIVAQATGAGVVVLNKDDAMQVGYATRSGGFAKVCKVGGYLYLVAAGVGVFRLDVSTLDCQTSNGNFTPSPWDVWADNTNAGSLPYDDARDIVGWTSAVSPNREYLAIVTVNTIYGGDRANLTIYNVTDSLHYDSQNFLLGQPAHLTHTGKRVYLSGGNLVNALYDAEAVSGDNFHLDCTVCGTVGDDFNDNDLCGWIPSTLWGSAVEQNQRLEMDVTTDADGTNRETNCYRAGLFAGDFTWRSKLNVPAWPDLSSAADGYETGWRIIVNFAHASSEFIEFGRWHMTSGGQELDYLRYRDDASSYTDLPMASNPVWLQVERDGTDVKLYCRVGDSGDFNLLTTFSNKPTSPVYLRFAVFSNYLPGGSWTQNAYVEDFQTDYVAGTAYAGMPNTDVQCLAVSPDTSTNDTSTIFAGFAEGLWGCDTDEDPTNRDDECDGALRGGYASAGQALNFLPVDSVDALACTEDAQLYSGTPGVGNAGAGSVAVGQSAGVTTINLAGPKDESADGYDTYDTSSGQPLVDNDVQCLLLSGSWTYGTDGGGGWFEVDDETPDDVALNLRVLPDSDHVLLGWANPEPESDWSHALLYRRHNLPGTMSAWQCLQSDETWGSGDDFYFDATNDFGMSWGLIDRSITAEKHYEYKLTQVDEAGNESDGSTADAYIDQPEMIDVTVRDPDTGSTTVTQTRGVEVLVTADSGDDSGNVTHAVEWIKIIEAGQSLASAPFEKYEAGKVYDKQLSDGAGSKIVQVMPYAQNGWAGAGYGSGGILYDPDAGGGVSAVHRNMIMAHDFAGDRATVDCTGGDDAFPAANAIDDRLGRKWQSDGVSTQPSLQFQFGGTKTVRYVAVLGHNLGSTAGAFAGVSVYIGYSTDGDTWVDTDVTALCNADDDPLVLDMEAVAAQYVRLRVHDSGGHVYQVGRVLVVCQDDGLVQPADNFAWNFGFGAQAQYTALHVHPSARYAANYRDARVAEIELRHLEQADKRALLRVFRSCGRHKPVLFLGRPEILPTRTDPSWSTTEDGYPENNLALYGYFADDEQLWNVACNELAGATLRLVEAVE